MRLDTIRPQGDLTTMWSTVPHAVIVANWLVLDRFYLITLCISDTRGMTRISKPWAHVRFVIVHCVQITLFLHLALEKIQSFLKASSLKS